MCTLRFPRGPKLPQYREAGVTVHVRPLDLPMRAPQRWPSLFRAFRALVADIAPDIIHSHLVSTMLMLAALTRRTSERVACRFSVSRASFTLEARRLVRYRHSKEAD